MYIWDNPNHVSWDIEQNHLISIRLLNIFRLHECYDSLKLFHF